MVLLCCIGVQVVSTDPLLLLRWTRFSPARNSRWGSLPPQAGWLVAPTSRHLRWGEIFQWTWDPISCRETLLLGMRMIWMTFNSQKGSVVSFFTDMVFKYHRTMYAYDHGLFCLFFPRLSRQPLAAPSRSPLADLLSQPPSTAFHYPSSTARTSDDMEG